MSKPFALLFWLTAVFYAVTVAIVLFAHVFDKPKAKRLAKIGLGVALASHTLVIAWRWGASGHLPVIGNFENALMGAWFIAAIAGYAGFWRGHPLVLAGSLPFALLLLGFGAMSDTTPGPMVAALDSFWLFIHIFFAWLAYGGYTVACGAGIVYLLKERKSAAREKLDSLDELMLRTTAFGFVTDAVMIGAGSLWAKNLWGSYWSWDPVESWSLLSWLVYGIALHLRVTMGWRGRRMAYVQLVAIVGVLISFWGVNWVMGGSEHVFNVD